jgi:hypothetical protein
MFYFDPSLTLQLLRLQEQEQAKRLELARLIREAQDGQPGLSDRVLLRVSDTLIAAGERLRERYTPLAESCVVGSAVSCATEG